MFDFGILDVTLHPYFQRAGWIIRTAIPGNPDGFDIWGIACRPGEPWQIGQPGTRIPDRKALDIELLGTPGQALYNRHFNDVIYLDWVFNPPTLEFTVS